MEIIVSDDAPNLRKQFKVIKIDFQSQNVDKTYVQYETFSSFFLNMFSGNTVKAKH